jgi:nondiscriminating aspartyl-tRNA synthetase
MQRNLIGQIRPSEANAQTPFLLRGWVYQLRALAKTTFIVLKDATGQVQCVANAELTKQVHIKRDDAIEIEGTLSLDARSKLGFEIHVTRIEVLHSAAGILPFNSASDLEGVGQEVLLDFRPLTFRNEKAGAVFKIQAALIESFRDYLRKQSFNEIFTSKIVASGTEGGTNLFEIKYFDRVAYLAQSPQFFKEYGVAGFERVFETGYVYRAEPHATVRHLTEYYSLDLEMGFITGPEEIIELQRNLLTSMFETINQKFEQELKLFHQGPLPSLLKTPIWEFDECLGILKKEFHRTDLVDDLDPQAERDLCTFAEKVTGVPAVYVIGFPLSGRPFYSHPRSSQESPTAQSFDLLFRGLEITTGGQRLHTRASIEAALTSRGLKVTDFEDHLRMFDFGMPPHGGLAIGAERLTAQVLGLPNVRQATAYPRDRNRISP